MMDWELLIINIIVIITRPEDMLFRDHGTAARLRSSQVHLMSYIVPFC